MRTAPLLLLASLGAAEVPLVEDRPIAVRAALENAAALYRSQLLGELDHPVGEGFTVAGKRIAARPGEKLELDLDGDGKWRSFAKPELIQWAPGLPKTRSGKIMRRILRKIACNELDNMGDTSTLADPSVVDSLIGQRLNR